MWPALQCCPLPPSVNRFACGISNRISTAHWLLFSFTISLVLSELAQFFGRTFPPPSESQEKKATKLNSKKCVSKELKLGNLIGN
jgi:hypothetical protein